MASLNNGAIRLRRLCLFLLDLETVGAALRRPETLASVDAVLQQVDLVSDKAANNEGDNGIAELKQCIKRWTMSRWFCDWEECVEWLLFLPEAAGCEACVRDVCQQVLIEIVQLFPEEEAAYNATISSFAEGYWKRALRRMHSQSEYEESAPVSMGGSVPHRVSWSIAGDLSPLVQQVFFSP
ncbi:hypothetical protein ERJ75_001057600 [Trypanosoma vivax]|uniref:Uncharacterized protein n=1 Tax=Trypanosoma vivax (strain Y486) TaxID=1055687 RepID=G0U0H2_TRYVY|nr:hypothetical protein ERJ75_001057600 [Trypanosoma vivax]CCC49570.1 conserved hypothetical protein [Trypanosoma vivax Y486]